MPKKKPEGVKLNLRFDETLHRKLKKSAEKRGLSLNSEILNRLEQSFQWDEAAGSARQLLADARKAVEKDLKSALLANGYTRLPGLNGGAWLEPGLDPLKVAFWTEPTAFQEAQEKAIRQIVREIVRQEKGESQ